MKEIKENIKNGKTSHVCGLDDLMLLRCPTTQSNLQSQCKPYQISNGIFRIPFRETYRKTLNSQRNPKKEQI